MSDLYDGSGFDSSFGVGTDAWVQEQLLDTYTANHADDDPDEREPDELDDLEDEPDDWPVSNFYDASGLRRLPSAAPCSAR